MLSRVSWLRARYSSWMARSSHPGDWSQLGEGVAEEQGGCWARARGAPSDSLLTGE